MEQQRSAWGSEHHAEDALAVAYAEHRRVGEEWNHVEWNARHYQIGMHRLYFRTDTGKDRAVLHLMDCDVELKAGMVCLVPAYSVRHSELSGEMSKYYVHFQSKDPILDLYRYVGGQYTVPANEITGALFQTVVDHYKSSTTDARMRVQGAMQMILADFYQCLRVDRSSLLRFEQVLAYMRQHFREHVTLHELASLMNISTVYFSNSFKAAFHISPKQYLLNMRLTESQRLLLQSTLSVKEIAYAVGFENENYFSEFFTAKMGISALKFRNRELPDHRESVL